MMARARPIHRRQSGQAMVEFVLIAPALALIVLAVVDFGRAFYTYEALANAAREGARYWALNSTTLDVSALTDGTAARVQGELDGRVTTSSEPTITSPDAAACPNTRRGCPVKVALTSDSRLITPLMGRVFAGGGDSITVRASATMVVW